MEEEDFTSKEADNEQSVTEAFNMMQMIKDESAQKNVKVYIVGTIFLGKYRGFTGCQNRIFPDVFSNSFQHSICHSDWCFFFQLFWCCMPYI